MRDVVALGELLIDFTPLSENEDGYPQFSAHPGGAPANFLAAIARFGGTAAFLGKVGDDAFGHRLVRTLSEAGIDTSAMVIDRDVFTTLAFVTLSENGDRDFSFARKPGADTRLLLSEVDLSVIDESRVLHFGTLSLTDEPARSTTREVVRYAREHGKILSCDPNLRLPLWDSPERAREAIRWSLGNADIVKLSDEEVRFLFEKDVSPEEGAELIMDLFPVKLCFVTCGPEGAVFRNQNGSGRVPALSGVRPVDTTGAGDIFGGSAMWKFLSLNKAPEALSVSEMREIALFASAAAGLSTEKYGGIPSVPALSDAEAAASPATATGRHR